jgi:hypothetical protein
LFLILSDLQSFHQAEKHFCPIFRVFVSKLPFQILDKTMTMW